MNNSQLSQIVRTILFAAGFGITLMAIILLAPFSPNSQAGTFVAVDLLMLYVMVFMPLLMGAQLERLSGGRIVALGIYWYALAAYAALTLFLVYLANTSSDVPVRILVVLQLAAMFVLMFATYLSSVTHGHIDTVEQASQNQRVSIEWLRTLADQLRLSTSQLAGLNIPRAAELTEITASIAEDLRYLSPVSNATAVSLENSIAANLDMMLQLTETSDIGTQTITQACEMGLQTKGLIAQRKAVLS